MASKIGVNVCEISTSASSLCGDWGVDQKGPRWDTPLNKKFELIKNPTGDAPHPIIWLGSSWLLGSEVGLARVESTLGFLLVAGLFYGSIINEPDLSQYYTN
eukprot:TRINITY_DN3497_c0_g1_i14.p2 TRINITY_DN3497_c0_g1~~TRINITY_DN3497_c0_g1_i14.p2  ORF type:complete len:102 (-),score=9.94 TRINITY_DN3497_c0_g1_i14:1299-1604(-)